MKRPRPSAGRSHLAELHTTFLVILPRVELHGRVYFRHKSPDRREELIAEMVGLCWRWFLRLVQRGKDPTQFVSALASYAARAVNSGRRVCGQERAKDVLSPSAQRRHGFKVEPLPDSTRRSHESLYGDVRGQRLHDAYEERLRDNTQTPVPEQVAFRLDWPAWLTTITERDRRLVEDLSLNHRTKDLASKYGLSPARISQKRREFHDDWERFCGERDKAAVPLV